MGQHLAKLYLLTMPAATALGGCSLIYNPSNLDLTDAAIDAPVIDACQLELTSVVSGDLGPGGAGSAVVYEGQGDGGSRPALLVIRGKNIAPDSMLEIRPATGTATFTVDRHTVAADFQLLAVTMTIPVDSALSADVPLDIKVSQLCNGVQFNQTLKDKLTLRGLKELDMASIVLTQPGNVANTSQLEALYSKIDLSGIATVAWTGTKRVELRATSSIVVAGLQANGNAGGATAAGAGGPGGCVGGNPGMQGGCQGGAPGGSTTTNGGAGGGGGFARVGTAGGGAGGAGGGAGGAASGTPAVATYEGNKGSGGGGGGAPVLNTGGGGGGGGGTIELTAGGTLQVTGKITANGGKGFDKNQGAGGGGSGGVVVLGAGTMLTVDAQTPASIDVSGGAGGAGTPAGGAGSEGRVRWDAAMGTAPSVVTPAVAHRGPTFDPATTALVRMQRVAFTLAGTTSDVVEPYTIDQDGMQVIGAKVPFVNGMATFQPTLTPGFNRVCVTIEGGERGKPESDKCVDVAYLP